MRKHSTPIFPNTVCEYCGTPFFANLKQRFCSGPCRQRGKHGRTLALDTPVDMGTGVAVVFLGHHRFTIIDSDDIERVGKHNWRLSTAKERPDYAVTQIGRKNVYLHRFILEAKTGELVDHINHDGMDNRKSNLRLATHRQNVAHQRVRSGTAYKGVQLRCDGKKWIARIQVDRKGHHLGSFATPEDAARAYDKAAILHFGEFAHLNFPD